MSNFEHGFTIGQQWGFRYTEGYLDGLFGTRRTPDDWLSKAKDVEFDDGYDRGYEDAAQERGIGGQAEPFDAAIWTG